eukprot:11221405-Lingulodinium_polyedra.AAC.1
MVRQAFGELAQGGKPSKGVGGITSGRRCLELLCSVAGVMCTLFQSASATFLEALVDDSPRSVVILRHLDSARGH